MISDVTMMRLLDKCGCRPSPYRLHIIRCPLHRSALELLKALKEVEFEMRNQEGHASDYPGIAVKCPDCSLCRIQGVIARAEKKA